MKNVELCLRSMHFFLALESSISSSGRVVVDKRDKNSDPDHPSGPPDPHQSQKLGTALHQNE